MKPLLKLIFGNGTRSVQAINLSANVVWFVLLTLPLFNVLSVDIPEKLYAQMYYPHPNTSKAVNGSSYSTASPTPTFLEPLQVSFSGSFKLLLRNLTLV